MDRSRGFPKECRCGEPIMMKTSNTARNPRRLFHACPFGDNVIGSILGIFVYHVFKWTDNCMVQEIEDLIEKVNNLEGTSITIQKSFNVCESEIDNLMMETRVCEAVVEKEVAEIKIKLRSLKNIVVFALVLIFFFRFIF
ncbi:putative transcription factor GRF family [Arabidopsis thaliana]